MNDSTDFPVILILTEGRSGSNLLADTLRGVKDNLRLMEVFHPITRGAVHQNETFFAALQKNHNCTWSSIDDPNLGEIIARDKVTYFNALCTTARELGYTSLSCKIFLEQIELFELNQILTRPNLKVIFLVRRHIDREISAQKALLTKKYIQEDTTIFLPEFNLQDFLNQAKYVDNGMERFWNAVQSSARPYTIVDYDRDINVADDVRDRRLSRALGEIGISLGQQIGKPPAWLVKQDTNFDWRDKVSNGFAVAASLAGLGLLDYAESTPLMEVLPSRDEKLGSSAKSHAIAANGPDRRDSLLREYGNFRCIAKSPMVTLTSIQFDRSYFAEWMAGPKPAFEVAKGVHFLRPTWSMQKSNLDSLGQSLRRAEEDNPGHIFIAFHVDASEEQNYRKSGIRSIVANQSIFEDETPWAEEAKPLQGIPDADALMIAILAHWKNHDLAAEVTSVNFVYDKPSTEDLARVQRICPHANFVNHRTGEYRYLKRPEMYSVMARAKVFLALSYVEGSMRASTEALLSGLPVVSVPSLGGRDAIYTQDNSLIVDPTPQAVRQGVKALIDRNLTRDEVRRATIDLIRPKRREFEYAANQAIAAHLGPLAPNLRVTDLYGVLNHYQTLDDFVEGLK